MYLISKEFDLYPKLLPFSGSSEEILEGARKELVWQTTTEAADRELTESEISCHRSTYTQIKETEYIELKEDIINAVAALDQAKSRLKGLQERHAAMLVEIDDHVRAIHSGIVTEHLAPSSSIAITVNNMRLHYTLTDLGLELAYVEPFKPNSGNLFENQEHNQSKFKEWFGVDYTPDTDFEIIRIQDAKDRKCARSISIVLVEDFIDEDSGEVASIDRTHIIVKANDIISSSNIVELESKNIETVVVYVEVSAQKGEKE